MSNAKHTPGPWNQLESGEFIDIIAANGDRVARVCEYGYWSDTPNAQQANARLIAAAPELLAALEMAVRRLAELSEQYNESGTFTADHGRAAIAKATESN